MIDNILNSSINTMRIIHKMLELIKTCDNIEDTQYILKYMIDELDIGLNKIEKMEHELK